MGIIRSGIDAIRLRRLMVIGRGDAGGPTAGAERRDAISGESVEEGGHVFVAEIKTVVSR